jgi:hypothetical protein
VGVGGLSGGLESRSTDTDSQPATTVRVLLAVVSDVSVRGGSATQPAVSASTICRQQCLTMYFVFLTSNCTAGLCCREMTKVQPHAR